jgi:hypothetical protein
MPQLLIALGFELDELCADVINRQAADAQMMSAAQK